MKILYENISSEMFIFVTSRSLMVASNIMITRGQIVVRIFYIMNT